MLRADNVVRGEQTERCDFRVFGKSRASVVLPRQTTEHTSHGCYAHGGADHQNRGVPEFRGYRHSPGQQHERVQTLGAQVVQREEHHLYQWVGVYSLKIRHSVQFVRFRFRVSIDTFTRCFYSNFFIYLFIN